MHCPKGDFPGDNFPSGNSQMCNFPSGNFPKVGLGPLRHRRLQWGPSAAAKVPSPATRTSGGPSAAADIDIGSCRLVDCTFGKFPIRNNSLGKYLTLIILCTEIVM